MVVRGFWWFGRVLAVLGALLLLYGLWLLGDTGSFDPVPVGNAGPCTSIETGVVIADAVLDPGAGMAYLTGWTGKPAQGALYALDLRAPALQLQRMTPENSDGLRPGGLGLYRGPDAVRSLFVIDHHRGAERVKIYDVTGMTATPRETISDPAFRSLGGIAPSGARQFYATNAASRFIQPFEVLFRLPLSDVIYFDGTLADPVATGLSTGRGLVLSPDGARLYVVEAMPHRIRVYARDGASAALKEERQWPLRAVPDEIDLDATGTLWLAGQARLFRLFLHRLDHRFPVPSQILTLDPAHGAQRAVHTDDGTLMANARIALFGEGMLIMADTEPRLLVCRPAL